MSSDHVEQAWGLLQQAYRAQMEGDYDRAIELYRNSLELHETAEAHTFLGWTYHFQGRVDDAIAECKRAIEVDPVQFEAETCTEEGILQACNR